MKNAFSLLNPRIRELIRKEGYLHPTPPQEKAIPVILKGGNVLLIAPTGWGKTEAVFFPLFHLLLDDPRGEGIKAIYVTPLRALNRDLFRRMQSLASSLGIRMAMRHGDTSGYERRKQLLFPPDILITTPETLQAILPAPKMREHLRRVRFVVVDEIHEIASSKRGTQLSLALERLVNLTGREFQRVGLSATVGSHEVIANFLGGVGRNVTIISIEGYKNMSVNVKPASFMQEDELEHGVERLISRVMQIANLIEGRKATLVFVNTREMAESLGLGAVLYDPEMNVRVHHGSLSKDVRVETEHEFKVGKLKGVISTSSLELGIDVGAVDFVVQYHSPRQVVRLVQRVGRSGHSVDRNAEGVILACGVDDLCEAAVIARRAAKGELEPVTLYEDSYDVLAHQVAGLVLDLGKTRMPEVLEVFKRSWPYRNLTMSLLREVASFLSQLNIIRVKDDVLSKTRITRKYYYENLSTIPDVKSLPVYDVASRKQIGELDESFIPRLESEGAFVMNGRPWRVTSIEDDKINVETLRNTTAALPSWVGEMIPVPFEVAQEVGLLRSEVSKWLSGEASACPLDMYPLSDDAKRIVLSVIESHMKEEVVPTHEKILVEKVRDSLVVIHACFGSLVNETLGRLIATSLSLRKGVAVSVKSTPYHILLGSDASIDVKELVDFILDLKESDVHPLITYSIKNSSLYLWHLLQVARRLGVLERNADYRQSNLKRIARIFDGSILEREAVKEVLTEKLDLERTGYVISAIKAGKINIYCTTRITPSPLAKDALEHVSRDLIQPQTPAAAITEAVRNRLLKERVKLVCMWPGCPGWESVRTVETLPEVISCPKCNGRLVAVTYYSDGGSLSKALRLKKLGKKLSKDDKRIFKRGLESAKVVSAYGKRAVICMAARGVGPRAALRILNRTYKSEGAFYEAILEEEKKYMRTRKFWDRREAS